MKLAGREWLHLTATTSQDPESHPAPLRALLKSALDQGATLVQVAWDPAGDYFNQGWARIVVQRDDHFFRNSGSGTYHEGRFVFELKNSGPLSAEETVRLLEDLVSKGTEAALRRLVPVVTWEAADLVDPPRRWKGLYDDGVVCAWLDANDGLNVKYRTTGHVFGTAGTRIAEASGDALILELFRWAGILGWPAEETS